MSHELHYTSVPRGLKPGSRGFSTVAQTAGLSQALAERLEGLSGYRPRFKPNDPNEGLNPLVWSHLRLTGSGPAVSVLSRVGPAGLDYTGRENKYAHHVVLDSNEKPPGGPAWLLSRPGFMASSWNGAPQVIDTGRPVPTGDRPGGVCHAWADQAGDAGWAGIVAEAFLNDPKRPAFVVYDPGADVLALFTEAIALLPTDRRWDVTFNTYFTGLAPGLSCAWRGVLRDTPEERQARANPEALLIDLARPVAAPPGGALVKLARTGDRPTAPSRPDRDRPPTREAAATSSSPGTPEPLVAVSSLQADFPAFDDEYNLSPTPPPPPRGRARRSPSGSSATTSRGGGSMLWPLLGTAVAAFVLGLFLGGAGIALLLRSHQPAAAVAVARVENNKNPATDTEPPKQAAPAPPSLAPAAPAPTAPEPQAKPQGGAPGADGTQSRTAKLPQPKSDSGSNRPVQPANAPPTNRTAPEVGRPTVDFFKIPLENVGNADGSGTLPSVSAGRSVSGLSLIGGEDKELEPFHFKQSLNREGGVILRVSVLISKAPKDVDVGTFEVKKGEVNRIIFAWSDSPEARPYDLRGCFLDCILEADLDNGAKDYYLLRADRIKALPNPLREEKHYKPPQKPAKTWDFPVPWCDDDKLQPGKLWPGRAMILRELKIIRDDGKPLEFRADGADQTQLIAKLDAAGTTIKVEVWAKDPAALGFSVSPRPWTDGEISASRQGLIPLREDVTTANDSIRGRIGDSVSKDVKDKNEELKKKEDLLDTETKRTRRVFDVLSAKVEALVTFKAGGIEFELPRIKSKGEGETPSKGAKK